MTVNGILQAILYLAILVLLVKPLGAYMARVYSGERVFLERLFGPVERRIYRMAGVDPAREMDWKTYAIAMLLFNMLGLLALYALQRIQHLLPLNPQGLGPVAPDLAFNTAASFVTNTNWQAYSGETTMSYLTQMLGLTVQNFLSAATGMAIAVALIRGIARQSAKTIGNFWVDMTRGVLYILLPIAFVLALGLVSQGAVQTLSPYRTVELLEPTRDTAGRTVTHQVIAVGPVASQVAIKHLGTNGGGFFNANAAHPFENPTPLTDLLLILAESAIAAAFTYTFGKMVGDTRQGWALLAVMVILLAVCIFIAYGAEAAGNPRLAALEVDQTASDLNPGGNMEGKEVRFGIARTAIFATVTTGTSTGAVNALHDSLTPLGGLVTLLMMQLGEIAPGGVGSGLYGILAFVIVAVFVAGMMVGRTPEYLGKKIEGYEMKMAALAVLIMPLVALGFTALAVSTEAGKAAVFNPGPHGFSEILYAYTSQANNNGSAFAGLAANNPFYNITGGLAMLMGRFFIAVPILALAGSLARKKRIPPSAGTLPTHTPLFVAWLLALIVIVAALNFIPALALGPIVEHFQMIS
ncbi:potassium-transporting ATPase subunit KdpA [Thermoflexus sp.]|uniref:potassium-transporting ATPase subunit KdpA n=1 Tax=Thermoflexus sp. TaxID=1969742 RepID=UPI0035E432D5